MQHNTTNSLKALREQYDLTQVQASIALGVSHATIQNWERGWGAPSIDISIEEKYRSFFDTHGEHAGKNMLFGLYPLSFARQVLRLSVEEIALKNGYSVNSWRRFEGNTRILAEDTLKKIEEEMRVFLLKVFSQ